MFKSKKLLNEVREKIKGFRTQSSATKICSQHISITSRDFILRLCVQISHKGWEFFHFTSYAFVGVTNLHKEQLVT